ncbi:hypothetical protein, partial [Klebsiella quasipneumoniae]|uniref:hypothetical protein n=1 Tax=Klebsiella quasipneumoniae TaxID=1463165 RepID=UPI00272FD533
HAGGIGGSEGCQGVEGIVAAAHRPGEFTKLLSVSVKDQSPTARLGHLDLPAFTRLALTQIEGGRSAPAAHVEHVSERCIGVVD